MNRTFSQAAAVPYRSGTGRGRRRLLAGAALAALSAAFCLAAFLAPQTAAGAITPCATAPTGPIVTLDGEGAFEVRGSGRRLLRRTGVKRGLIRPANATTGRPSFPVEKVRFGATSRVWLKGGLAFKRKKRRVVAKNLTVVVPKNARKPARVTARLGGGKVTLFRLSGGRRVIRNDRGEIDLMNATSRLGGKAVTKLNRRLGLMPLKKRKRLSAKVKLDRFEVNATYFKVVPDDPVAETPPEPPVAVEPSGAAQIGTASIDWELRDSWIDYVNTGQTPKVGGGTVAGSPRPPKNLVYSYSFPFSSGWTVPSGAPDGENSLIKGSGSLAFRFCPHTINFKISAPEIELSDDQSSRMIFRVDGTDGTAFPDQRAVMIKLRPSMAASHTAAENDGIVTETWDRIPGYIPAEGTGIFAGFYPSYDPVKWDATPQKSRPDRFGYLTVTYTYPAAGG